MSGKSRLPVRRGPATQSIAWLPHCEQTRRVRHSGTGRSAPWRAACSPGSTSTQCRQRLHQVRSSRSALAVLPSVRG